MSCSEKLKMFNSALSLLEAAGVDKPPVAVDKIAKFLGAKVRYSPLDEELSGMVFIKDDKSIIGVNALHHPNRQRFTIAHEIGHLCLHCDQIDSEVHVDKQFPMLMRDKTASSGIDSIEIQANHFAAELLMPEKFINEYLENNAFEIDDDSFISKIAKKFKVSPQAIQFRLGQVLR